MQQWQKHCHSERPKLLHSYMSHPISPSLPPFSSSILLCHQSQYLKTLLVAFTLASPNSCPLSLVSYSLGFILVLSLSVVLLLWQTGTLFAGSLGPHALSLASWNHCLSAQQGNVLGTVPAPALGQLPSSAKFDTTACVISG